MGRFGTFWDILGHIRTVSDNSDDFLTSLGHLDFFPTHFRPFSPIIGSLKKKRYRRTDGPTNRPSYRDARTQFFIYIYSRYTGGGLVGNVVPTVIEEGTSEIGIKGIVIYDLWSRYSFGFVYDIYSHMECRMARTND